MLHKLIGFHKNARKKFLWEIIRYWPKSLRILDSTCQRLEDQLYKDLSLFWYFLEEIGEKEDVRLQKIGRLGEVVVGVYSWVLIPIMKNLR